MFKEKKNDKVRARLREILLDGIDGNPNVLGAGIFFEPNGFDGRDKQFANKNGYDKSGRISDFFYRSSTGEIVKDLADTSNLDNELWYKRTMEDGKAHFYGPYLQKIDNGKEVVIGTVSIPIINLLDQLESIIGIADASGELSKVAGELQEIIQVFKI